MTRVTKIGGNELNAPGFLAELAGVHHELTWLGGGAVIVHGGGQEIATMQTRLGIQLSLIHI